MVNANFSLLNISLYVKFYFVFPDKPSMSSRLIGADHIPELNGQSFACIFVSLIKKNIFLLVGKVPVENDCLNILKK